jgi:hypothetical protein
MLSHYTCQHLFLVNILLSGWWHDSKGIVTGRRKQCDIGHTKSLAGDRESPLQAFCWQAECQTIGIEGRSLALEIHADERRRSKIYGKCKPTLADGARYIRGIGFHFYVALPLPTPQGGVGATLKMGHRRTFQLSKLETVDEAVSRLSESAECPRLYAGPNSPRPGAEPGPGGCSRALRCRAAASSASISRDTHDRKRWARSAGRRSL